MCYPCSSCGRCGKFDPSSPLYVPPPAIPCLKCGATVDAATGACPECGYQAFAPRPQGQPRQTVDGKAPDASGAQG